MLLILQKFNYLALASLNERYIPTANPFWIIKDLKEKERNFVVIALRIRNLSWGAYGIENERMFLVIVRISGMAEPENVIM